MLSLKPKCQPHICLSINRVRSIRRLMLMTQYTITWPIQQSSWCCYLSWFYFWDRHLQCFIKSRRKFDSQCPLQVWNSGYTIWLGSLGILWYIWSYIWSAVLLFQGFFPMFLSIFLLSYSYSLTYYWSFKVSSFKYLLQGPK